MSDDKKAPQPFNTSLFSSPGGAGSGGLSLGFDEPFSSPFSLAPALSTSSGSKQSEDGGKKTVPVGSPFTQSTLSSSPARQGTPPKTNSPRRSSSPAVPVTSSGNISLTGLSTVSLESPTSTAEVKTSHPPNHSETLLEPSASLEPTGPVLTSAAYNDSDIDYRGGGKSKFGWNDPPVWTSGQTPNRPAPSRSITAPEQVAGDTDNYSIQPHLETPALSSQLSQPAPSNTSIPNPNPPGQGPPPSQPTVGSNPYRIGVGIGNKKPAYGVSGIASFGPNSQLPSQPMVVPNQPPPPSSAQSFSQPPPLSQAPHPASYETLPPPVTSSTYPPPSQADTGTGGGWGSTGQPLWFHWFYLRGGEKYWIPFSVVDSGRLEESLAVCGQDPTQEVLVPTDGGRYDVNLHRRQRQPVYWEEPVSEVRRCSWFFKGEGDRWYLPYDELTAATLEEEYLSAFSQGQWNRRVELTGGETVIMHSQSAIVHYPPQHHGSMVPDDLSHPRSVLRGFAEIEKVDSGEQTRVDHLVFVVHGIGAHCDLNFRSLVDCVDDFREVSQLMLKTHQFSQAAPRQGDSGGRVEYLPVHWHTTLHKDECGVDQRLKPLTLPSISRLRDFTNSTLTDILFFTSPVYCQKIINQVASEMNRMFEIFKARNPGFHGDVSVTGHSLGSCVLFDLLDHQQGQEVKGEGSTAPSVPDLKTQSQDISSTPSSEPGGSSGKGDEPDGATPTIEEALQQLGLDSLAQLFQTEQIDYESLLMCTNDDLKEIGVAMGPRKKLSSFIVQQAELKKRAEERREKEERERSAREKEQQRQQETVNASFHRATLQGVKIVRGLAGTGQPFIDYPQLTFHPKHLFAVGSPIGLFLSVRGVEELGPGFRLPTCPSVFNIFHPFDPVAYRLEPLVTEVAPIKPVLMAHHKGRKRFHLELYENIGQVSTNLKTYLVDGMRNMWQQLNEFARSHTASGQEQLQVTDAEVPQEEPEPEPAMEPEVPIGSLNQGGRIDFVLQEKPIEKLNEYLFALSSHLCYWRSEDTALFILKEVYGEPDPQLIKS